MKEVWSLINDNGMTLSFIIRIILAAILGGLIGHERQTRSKEAGMKTHILVCVGSALIMIVSQYGFYEVIGNHIDVDPSRIAAQVVSGIGFLGAGVIFKESGSIKGLTTAAGIWCVGAIGLAVGSGLYFIAIIFTVFILLVFAVLNRVSGKYYIKTVEIQIISLDNKYIEFIELLKIRKMHIIAFKVIKTSDKEKVVNIKMKPRQYQDIQNIVNIVEESKEMRLDFFDVV